MKTLFVLLLVLIAGAEALATNGTRMIGFHARAAGRGGAAIGLFDNSGLMMTNPAGIAFLDAPVIDVQFGLMVPRLEFSNALNNEKGRKSYYPLPALSYASPEPGGAIAWGIGAFTQGGMGADFFLNHDLFRLTDGSFWKQDYFSQLAVMQGGPSIAWRISPEFAVGASAHLVYSQMEFRMPYSLSPSALGGIIDSRTGLTFGDMFSAPPSAGGFGYSEVTASAKMLDLTAFGFGGKIGLAWKPSDRTSIGLCYTSATPLTYKNGTAGMDMTAQLNDAFGRAVQGALQQDPSLTPAEAQQMVARMFTQLGIDLSAGVAANYDLEAELTFPQSIGFGASYAFDTNFRMAVDVEWINWAEAFDVMTLNLAGGDNANINRLLGNDGTFSLEFPLAWEDATVMRVGLEYEPVQELTLRAGGAFGTNPVPATTLFPVFPAITENHAMVGATVRLFGVLGLHAAYEHAFPNTEKSAATNLLAREYDNSTDILGEDIYHVSLSWTIR